MPLVEVMAETQTHSQSQALVPFDASLSDARTDFMQKGSEIS